MQKLEDMLKPNDTHVAAKVFDGEAIIMNLTTGMYFSADKVGASVWELIEKGRQRQFNYRLAYQTLRCRHGSGPRGPRAPDQTDAG